MRSKYGKNKKVAHEAIAECVTDVTEESRRIGEIPPDILNAYISELFLGLRINDSNEEYEPNFLRPFMASFETHLTNKKIWI